MVLESLLELVKTLRARIDEYGAALRQSEALTRATLIDPLLRELGWDTEDPALVMPEYRLGRGLADYALLSNSKPIMMVEAKRLGTPLVDAASQGIGYCIEDGVAYFAVTDGRQWEIYETHKMAPIADKLTVQFDIAQSPAVVCLQALALWHPSVAAGSVSLAQAPIIEPQQEEAPVEHPEPTPAYSPPAATQPTPPRISERQPASDSPESLRAQLEKQDDAPRVNYETNSYGSNQTRWTPLSLLAVRAGDSPPVEIQSPDGKRAQISRWKDVTIESARWLMNVNYLNETHCPIQRGKRFLVAVNPIHPNGNNFKAHALVGSLYIETNYSAKDCVRNAIDIIQHTGQDPSQFKVRFANQMTSSHTSAPEPVNSDGIIYSGADWIPMSDLDIRKGDSRPSPAEIQFPDGKRMHAGRWTHVMRETIRWLIDNRYLDQSHCPIQYASRYIIADTPVHPTGSDFIQEIVIGEFYIEMNYSPPECIRNYRLIIERVGLNPADFKVRFAS